MSLFTFFNEFSLHVIPVDEAKVQTFSKASSVFSGLALSAWDASMMGRGMKRIVKFLRKYERELLDTSSRKEQSIL